MVPLDKDFAPTFEITEISGANEAVITVKSELNRTIASYYDVSYSSSKTSLNYLGVS